jgi:hypothetical protein
MSSWGQANRGENLGLVWRNRKKISQIINDYLYLPFFLFIILCMKPKARGLPGWLEESDPAGCDFERDGRGQCRLP